MTGITEDMCYVQDVNSMIDFLNKHKAEIKSIYFGDRIETYPIVSPVRNLVGIAIISTIIIKENVVENHTHKGAW